MTDVLTKEERSRCMAAIKSHGNKHTELRLVAIFRSYRITGWRRNQTVLGKPDFLFPKARLAVFIDGCFWHGCSTHLRMPKSNTEYWDKKISRNIVRDRQNNKALKSLGWRVLRIWEHDLKKPSRVAKRIAAALKKQTLALPKPVEQCRKAA